MIHTSACDVLGIEHPVIQAGMAGHTNAELVAAVSNAGGLGILAGFRRSADALVQDVRRVRSLTDRPFGVNFVLHLLNEETFRTALTERIPVFSLYRGDPADAVAQAHAVGSLVIDQITTVAEAEYARAVGVDVLVAQGAEAGGHTGLLPLWNLLPEVVKVAGSRPVLAAGGIVDGQGLAAALSFGASGVLMGTRFLATPESPATPAHKQAILAAQLGDTVASPMLDILRGEEWPGIQVRTFRNPLTARWAGHEAELRSAVAEVRAEQERARAAGDDSLTIRLVGEGAARIHDLKPAGQIVRDTVAEAEQILQKLNSQID
jgi:nitronate monooxygenase